MIFSHLAVSTAMLTSCLIGFETTEGISRSETSGRVSHVTLYRNQAMITRTIKVSDTSGNSEIVIGISANLLSNDGVIRGRI